MRLQSLIRFNFKCLCTGERGTGELYLRPLHLKGCSIFRVIKDQLIQTGDMVHQNGLGGESIYGGKFEDENLEAASSHGTPGLLSMANDGTSVRISPSSLILAISRMRRTCVSPKALSCTRPQTQANFSSPCAHSPILMGITSALARCVLQRDICTLSAWTIC